MAIFNGEMRFRNPKKPLILYFIAGMVPTHADKVDAATLPYKVSFRNARMIDPEHPLEPCDLVAGDVPPSYAKIPRAVPVKAGSVAQGPEVPPAQQAPPQPSPAAAKGWGKA